ncbi:transcriptional regulator PadR-like family protein [Rhodococcus sp. MTM3W5.2]|uniref:PadR family transcriptional regulator n=1 Tax=Rhodococcus sp. MTM3W5.2 TaxID=1805827 RepID=UPI0009794E97|nr:helix-turn-helix transcriptional regulator [Rhodococcus sp. MTM3W5.2]AQA23308.1 transcriptional regulator PadR-like family protein [Rhodococcus sp. MTM3W5.2]
MPKNALDNPLVLPILGLLVEQPRHAYALFRELTRRYEYLQVRNATVYTLLDRLTADGWVTAASGNDRAAIAVTESGVAALAERVRQQLREGDPTGGPTFVTALAYLGILQPAEAATVLERRVELIREAVRELEQAAMDPAEPEVHMIEAQYLLSRLRHDIDWLERTAQRIEAGGLSWIR